MCIAGWIWQSHPAYQLLLFLNRDEFHDRPTEPVGWWGESNKKILGGRDEKGGGTWLGCTNEGRVAFLTNFRETDSLSGAKTRGALPLRFLEAQRLHDNLKELLEKHGNQEVIAEQVIGQLMGDKSKADRDKLPNTGHLPEWELELSPIFVETDTEVGCYGTRSMAALAAKVNGEVIFYERYLESGMWKEHTIRYQIENASAI